jgi:hypothetical protein
MTQKKKPLKQAAAESGATASATKDREISMMVSKQKRDDAAAMLRHYFWLCMPNHHLTADNSAEIDSIVDLILTAAVERMKAEAKP